MSNKYNPSIVHNVLADAYNSTAKGAIRSTMPNADEFMRALSQNKQKDEVICQLHDALKLAKLTIEHLHNLDSVSKSVWPIYEAKSPEMQSINCAIKLIN